MGPVTMLQLHVKRRPMARRLTRAVTATGLVAPNDSILVSVSGGPDSLAMLSLLVELAPQLHLTLQVVHFNHGLRGVEADQDEGFVASLCERLKVAYHCLHLDLAAVRRRGRSLQEIARERRYAALVQLAQKLDVNKVALGHTADDQAETVLMWMLRGTGLSGLAGMPAHRKPFFIRPLLTVTRAEILAYLAESQLAFRTDSSNAKSLYLRNRVRHELLPVLKQLRPAVVSVLRRQADILREDDDCLEAWTSDEVSRLVREAAGGQWELERDTLLALPVAIQRRIVRQLLRRVSGLSKGPSFRSILTVLERVIHGQADTVVVIGSVRVARRSTLVQFRHIQDGRRSDRDHQDRTTAMPVPAERPSQVGWPLTGQIVSFSEETAAMTGRSPTSSVAVLDADRFTMNLQLRAWRSGDVFQPLGMHGQRKKLREFFIDRKVPRDLRRRVPLLVAPEGILWVAGYQLDERFRVTAETRRRLIVEVTGPTSPVANAD